MSSEPVVRIGVAEGSADEQLYQVRAVARLEDGTVAVANGGSAEIRLFDRSGGFVRAIGGRGEGPGEFAFLQHLLVLRGDTLVAGNLNMLTRFDRDGAYLGSRRTDWTFLSSATHFAEWSWPLAAGASVVQLLERSLPRPHDELFRPLNLFVVVGPEAEWVDTVGMFPGLEQMTYEWAGEEEPAIPLFPAQTAFGIHGSMLVIGDSDADSVVWYDARTRAHGSVPIVSPQRAITPAELRAAEATACDWASGEDRARCDRGLTRIPEQTHLPSLELVEPDTEGLIWIGEPHLPSETQRRWSVLTRDGQHVADVSMPAGLRVMEIGPDYILGVVRDEYDVEYVVEHGLTRGPANDDALR